MLGSFLERGARSREYVCVCVRVISDNALLGGGVDGQKECCLSYCANIQIISAQPTIIVILSGKFGKRV